MFYEQKQYTSGKPTGVSICCIRLLLRVVAPFVYLQGLSILILRLWTDAVALLFRKPVFPSSLDLKDVLVGSDMIRLFSVLCGLIWPYHWRALEFLGFCTGHLQIFLYIYIGSCRIVLFGCNIYTSDIFWHVLPKLVLGWPVEAFANIVVPTFVPTFTSTICGILKSFVYQSSSNVSRQW